MRPGVEPLLLVGAGKMGGAMLARWLDSGLSDIVVIDPHLDPAARSALTARGVAVLAAALEASGPFATIVLAVKPQSMAEALGGIAPLAGAATTIVSIAAGIRIATLEAGFPAAQPVVRAMPNTPAQVGQGMSVAVANAHADASARERVTGLLAAVGEVAWIDDEGLIDAVTAVSGSGPAYVFLLAECLAAAAVEAGLPAELGARLARQTVAGAGALLSASAEEASVLRRNVTSPGGTTAAALGVLMAEDGLQPLLTRAVAAAKRRSVELG